MLEIVDVLKRGDTADLYLARDGGAEVVLKLLHDYLAGDPLVAARFEREAQTLARLDHPAIVRVLDIVKIDDRPGIVMEHLSGGALADKNSTEIDSNEVLLSVAPALDVLHGAGIIHRDIRPSHIVFDRAGRPKLVDLNAASVKDLAGLTRSSVHTTQSGYLDPYTWGRGTTDGAVDIYGLGASVYAAVMGAPPSMSPFAGGTRRISEADEKRLAEAVGRNCAEVIIAMLDDPTRRPRSGAEVVAWLQGGRRPVGRDFRECIYCGAHASGESPICLSCGRPPITVKRDPTGEFLLLKRISEEQEILAPFIRRLRLLSNNPGLKVHFLTEDSRLYSRTERLTGTRLPVPIVDAVAEESATALIDILQQPDPRRIHIERVPMRRRNRHKREALITIAPSPSESPEAVQALHQVIDFSTPTDNNRLTLECRQALAIASGRLTGDGTTGEIFSTEAMEKIWRSIAEVTRAVETTEQFLATADLRNAYDTADAEIFRAYDGARYAAAAARAGIIDVCRTLEAATPASVTQDLLLIEDKLKALLRNVDRAAAGA